MLHNHDDIYTPYFYAGGYWKSRRAAALYSAGGYTTLAALAFENTFKAGASLYGVSA